MADRIELKSPLEGLVVKGIQYVHVTSLSRARQPQTCVGNALVVAPKMRCYASIGRGSVCDRVIRLYRNTDSIPLQDSIPEGDVVLFEQQNDKEAEIRIFTTSYKIHAPDDGRLSIEKLDFSKFANEYQRICEVSVWDNILQRLK